MEYKIKHPLGKEPMVFYRCTTCGVRLESPLEDACREDYCPNCRVKYIVPGQKEKEKEEEIEIKRAEAFLIQHKKERDHLEVQGRRNELDREKKYRANKLKKQARRQRREKAADEQLQHEQKQAHQQQIDKQEQLMSVSDVLEIQENGQSREKYRALKILSDICNISAWIILVLSGLSLLFGAMIFAQGDNREQGVLLLVYFIGALVMALYTFAIAQGIRLVLDLKTDTSMMCALLKQLLEKE